MFTKPSKPIKKFEQYFIDQNPRLNILSRIAELEIACKRKIIEANYDAELFRVKGLLKEYFLTVLRTIHSRKHEINTKRAFLMLSVPPDKLSVILD